MTPNDIATTMSSTVGNGSINVSMCQTNFGKDWNTYD